MDLLTLDMIVRSDAAGLERATQSARPHVDRVIVGVDERSNDQTLAVAKRVADEVWTFGAADIGLTPEAWAADRIDFAAARNLGRARVKTPWTLVIDSDEFLECFAGDLRAFILEQDPSIGAISLPVKLDEVIVHDHHRVARSEFLWRSHTHNQLEIEEKWKYTSFSGALVTQQLDLRTKVEQERRLKQRNAAVETLKGSALEGDLAALYHVAKQAVYDGAPDRLEWVNKFRLSTEIHGEATKERATLAFITSCEYLRRLDFAAADQWAVRTLLDGPNLEVFCLLGDIAENQGRKQAALIWYEIACATPPSTDFSMPEMVEKRFERRDELRQGVQG